MKWILPLALAACGPASTVTTAEYADLCATGCATTRPDACLEFDTAGCQADCEDDTAGRSPDCAQCMAAHINWRTSLCDSSTGQCAAGAMTCTGWSVTRSSSTACKPLCP